MNSKRVVVTGLGLVTPVGIGKDIFWSNLLQGKSGISEVTNFDATEYDTKIAGEVKNFVVTDFVNKKEARRMDPFVHFALAASQLAIDDSRLDISQQDATRVGVVIGTGVGGMQTFESQYTTLSNKGPNRVSPFMIPMMIANMAAGHISIQFGAKGPNTTIINACASSTNAVGEAFEVIKRGDADIMITGGTEACVTPMAFAGFCAMKAMSTRNSEPEKASRPFELNRDGFVMGEGAAILILESEESALNRGADIYAEVLGYGCTADGFHITAPAEDGEGAVRSMKMALNNAGLTPGRLDYINAHGTSTKLNDNSESAAIKTIFSGNKELLVSSTKSMMGHLLGAAGAAELAVLALVIQNSKIPPTINYEEPDPLCDFHDFVPNVMREKIVNYAMSNSFGFGGHNASVVFGKYNI